LLIAFIAIMPVILQVKNAFTTETTAQSDSNPLGVDVPAEEQARIEHGQPVIVEELIR
jgi:hypothetical protein